MSKDSVTRAELERFDACYLAVPCVDWMWTASARAIMRLSGRLPSHSEVGMESSLSTIAEKRNRLCRMFLQSEAEWMLFVDSDMVPPADTFLRLARREVDMVSALYFGRVPPHPPIAGYEDGSRLTDFGAPTLKKVDWVGFGCVLLRRGVVEALGPGWFRALSPGGAGEDNYFCRKASAAGFDIHVDTELCAGHVGATSVNADYVSTYWRTQRSKELGLSVQDG